MAKYVKVNDGSEFLGPLFGLGIVGFILYSIYKFFEPYFWIMGITIFSLIIVFCIIKIIKNGNIYAYIFFPVVIIFSAFSIFNIAYSHFHPKPEPSVKQKPVKHKKSKSTHKVKSSSPE